MTNAKDQLSVLDEPLELLLGWFLATVAGYYLGDFGGRWLVGLSGFEPMLGAPLAGLVKGACIGLGQWWLLRGRLSGAFLWIPASFLGFSLAAFVEVAASPLARMSGVFELILITLQGGLLGLFQWIYLRKKVPFAYWWIPALALSAFVHNQLMRIVFLLVSVQWLYELMEAIFLAGVTGYIMLLFLERRPLEAPKREKLHRSLRPRAERQPRKKPPASKPPESLPVGRSLGEGPPPARPDPEHPAGSAGATEKLPTKLVLIRRKTRLQEAGQEHTAAADFVFVLPLRPRRARLRISYSGISPATLTHFQQQVQMNDTSLMEFQARGRKLGEVVEYVQRIPEELFSQRNRVVFISRSDGTDQAKNPFAIHAAQLEFDWQ